MTANTTSFYIQPFNDLQDQFYGIVQSLPSSTTFYTSSINTAEFDNYRDGVFLRTVNDYFKSDQVKVTFLPTSLGFVGQPNGVIDHEFEEDSIIGLSGYHSYTVNGDSVAFRDQVQGVDQTEFSQSINFPGMIRYFKQSAQVLSGAVDVAVVYPFFVDNQNKAEFNGFMIEPFPLYTDMARYVVNPLSVQSGFRGNAFLGLDDAENANPQGSAMVAFGQTRNQGSAAEYQRIQPRPYIDSGADMILVKPGGMFVGRTTQRDNDVLPSVSCSMLTPWKDEYSGRSFVEITAGTRATSLIQLLSQSLPLPNNDSVRLPYYAGDGYAFGKDLDIPQTRDQAGFSSGWTADLSCNQHSLYGIDSVAFAGYTR